MILNQVGRLGCVTNERPGSSGKIKVKQKLSTVLVTGP